ncbi:MAG: DUF368 domain-containing protein [bacterium]|nr:DUF368 domain-containing protein [bacterium]
MKFIMSILKGMVMGAANIIPGVSGGTLAVSMGIYDEIISSINNLFKQFKKSALTLLPYFIGMGASLVGLSFIIKYCLTNYSLQTNVLFVGLILGGLPVILDRFRGKKVGAGAGIAFVIAFAAIISLQLLGSGGGSVVLKASAFGMIQLFFVGVIASATMVVPGVSGSMILMILGFYDPVLGKVTEFFSALKAFDMAAMLDGAKFLVPFGLGVVIGIFAIAKIIEFLLNKFEVITFAAILGLIIASPFAIFMSAEHLVFSFGTISISVVTFIIGFAIAFFLGRE